MGRVGRPGQTMSATRFAELSGVSRERLRTWERRFGFPVPERVQGGRRRYRRDDVGRVVAVRRAAEDGTPLAVAIARAAVADVPAPPAPAFEAAVELAPVPVALVSGPEPLRLEYANAALRELGGTPADGAVLASLEGHPAGDLLRDHFARSLAPAEVEHPAWHDARCTDRSLVYRLPAGSAERPVVAVVGVGTRGEREARRELARRDAELGALRARAERHDRWLDALATLADTFMYEPGPDVVQESLDVLIRQTRAADAALATYLSGRLALRGSRRGVLNARTLTVAAHPDLGRALRDAQGIWLDATAAHVIGLPPGLHASGVPIAVAGEVLGLLLMVFDEVEPHDEDNRRLLASISSGVAFAVLRDRLARELRAAVSPAARSGRRAAGGRSTA